MGDFGVNSKICSKPEARSASGEEQVGGNKRERQERARKEVDVQAKEVDVQASLTEGGKCER